MGMFKLKDFRSLLSTTLGDRGLANPRLDLWILLGYIEVLTAVEHDALRVRADLDTEEDVFRYPLPSGFLGVDSLADYANGYVLMRTSLANWERLSRRERGAPRVWAREGNCIVLWPTPGSLYPLEMMYVKEPARMESDEDRTALPATWDNAVYLLSVHYALAALDRVEESQVFFTRAIAYIKSRLTDADYAAGSPALPVGIGRSYEDLQRVRPYL